MTLMAGISGVRGIVGESMTPEVAADLGRAFGAHAAGGTVVVGRDSRPGGPALQRALADGLLAAGCDVIDLDVVSTPGVALMVSRLAAAGGVVVTASHNPAEWNGVKFLSSRGCAPSPEEARAILDRFHARRRVDAPCGRSPQRVARGDRPTERTDSSAAEAHVAAVLAHVRTTPIVARRFRIVLDSVNGAGGAEGRRLLEALGCTVEHLNAEPTGRFAHPPEPLAENLSCLCDAVRRAGADAGFAQDPDADRLAIVDDTGRYIGEEYTLALSARRRFERNPGPAAANLSTSRMIDDLAARAGGPCRVFRTPVGEAHVAAAVVRHGCVIGGEGNGGVILPGVVLVRDSLAAMGLVLELLAAERRTLTQIVDSMPRYAMIKRKIKADRPQIDAWLVRLRRDFSGERLDDSDGLRIDWPAGWVHVRPSNTEPIARLIAEAADEPTAVHLAHRTQSLL